MPLFLIQFVRQFETLYSTPRKLDLRVDSCAVPGGTGSTWASVIRKRHRNDHGNELGMGRVGSIRHSQHHELRVDVGGWS